MTRLLEKPQAASYIGVSADEMRHVPIKPVKLFRKDGKRIRKVLYDKVDLDHYIDSCKGESCQKEELREKELISNKPDEDIARSSSQLMGKSTLKPFDQKMKKKSGEYSANVLRKWAQEYP